MKRRFELSSGPPDVALVHRNPTEAGGGLCQARIEFECAKRGRLCFAETFWYRKESVVASREIPVGQSRVRSAVLRVSLNRDRKVRKYLKPSEIDACFNIKYYTRYADRIFKNLGLK